MTTLEDLIGTEVKGSPDHIDEDGYISIWNVAADSCEGDQDKARALAAQLLGFLCKKSCDFVVMSSTDAEYLDEWLERDKKLLNDWNLGSETVDVLSQHAQVPYKALIDFLSNNKFNPKTKHSPKRADRAEWFQNVWNVG
jgi:predicted transcriptional regulator